MNYKNKCYAAANTAEKTRLRLENIKILIKKIFYRITNNANIYFGNFPTNVELFRAQDPTPAMFT